MVEYNARMQEYVRGFNSSFDPSHVTDPSPLPTGCTPVPAPIPHWVMIVPIVVGLLLFAVIAIIAAKLIIVFLVRICSSYIHHLCLHSETVYCGMHCAPQ